MHHDAVEANAFDCGEMAGCTGVAVDDVYWRPLFPVLAFEEVINDPKYKHVNEEWHDEHDEDKLELRVLHWVENDLAHVLPEVKQHEQRYQHFLHHHDQDVQSALAKPGPEAWRIA